ncbi:MAG: hypothetical protein H7330_03125 [Hymenobacteraceae bacterium]|nr:hypothetical protein [Hymenobacteraceae bacterium]
MQARFTPHFVSLPEATLTRISPTSVGGRLLRVVAYTVVRLLGNLLCPIRNGQSLRGVPWLYVVSPNNVEALRFVERGLPDAVLVAGQGKNLGRYGTTVNRLSLRRKLLYYGQLPAVWRHVHGAVGQSAVRFFDLVVAAIGYYEVYRRALRHYRPTAVIFANDHNDDARALLLACQVEGVPTAYIQHASVSRWFPPLGFDLSLLEGQHALDTYRECGPISGRVALVGMPKADAFLSKRNKAPTVRRVAIAANLLDPTDALLDALATLLPAFPDLTFTFRAHPGDTRDFPHLLQPRFSQLHFSDARIESIFDFLIRHDALIAADTSTHLEATLLNLASFYFRFGAARGFTDDYYGYVRHGLVESANSLPELLVKLRAVSQRKPNNLYRRATYYCATLATPTEGHSEAIALKELKNWLARNTDFTL